LASDLVSEEAWDSFLRTVVMWLDNAEFALMGEADLVADVDGF
jgi:hypothetical protein